MEIDIKSEIESVLDDAIYKRCRGCWYDKDKGCHVTTAWRAEERGKLVKCYDCEGKGQKLTSFGEQLRDLIREVVSESKATEK